MLNELVDRDDLLALDYHVDYWDYTGWHDTFAKPEFVKRQRHYAKHFRYKSVYTPQIVVNGSRETVGSDRAAVLALIKAATDEAHIAIRLVPTENGGLRISAAAGTGAATADLWLVTFERGQTVEIGKGENQGRRIRYSNVVCDSVKVGTWTGAAVELTLQPSEPPGDKGKSWAVILQEPGYGRILGAARLDPTP